MLDWTFTLLRWANVGLASAIGLGLLGAAVLSWIYVPVVGRKLAVGLAVAGLLSAAYGRGYGAGAGSCDDAALRAALAAREARIGELQRQAEMSARLVQQYARDLKGAEADFDAERERADSYANELARRPGGACALDRNDVGRMP